METYDKEDVVNELSKVLSKYEGQPEMVRALLSGEHILTGIEMTEAYRKGSCAMRSALNECCLLYTSDAADE